MKLNSEFVRLTGCRKGYPRQLRWVVWLAVSLIASPAMANPEMDESFQSEVFTQQSLAIPVVVANDGELQGAQAKGMEQQTLHASEHVAVILWDEPGTGRRTGLLKNNDNSLVMIRYTGSTTEWRRVP